MLNSVVSTQYWHALEDDRVQCDVCPRACKLREGQRGLCYVRGRENDEIKLYSYGRSSGFCIDPIEKKPLNHFYPGSSVLSFGTAGCNLACKFCQNWDMSKSREMDTLCDEAMPDQLAITAKQYSCESIAFTYNDPVIFLEYAMDVADACRALQINSVAVSAGYICPDARRDFYAHMDAANIDLKAFTEQFYKKVCGGSLAAVLDTLLYLKQETSVWFEITTLLIPEQNDSDIELHQQCEWIYENLGADVPLHFSAFHPDWKMTDIPRTPQHTLTRARDIALKTGLNFVYTGNVHDPNGSSTYCPNCRALLIERDWYELGVWTLNDSGHCKTCGEKIPGKFKEEPGDWGARRMPVRIMGGNK
ncbi:MAG: AmmeMemoRadiSam system radical SAM enzyme [Bermanella sp.]